jgi:hypothetical protein
VRAAGTALPWPGAQAAQGLLTRQNAYYSQPRDTCPLSVCGPAGSPAARVLRVTLAAGADGQPGGRAVRRGDLPWLRGKRCPGPEERGIMPSAVAPRVVAALRPGRLGRWRMHGAATAPHSARPARERACSRRGHARRRGRSARRGWGSGASSPLLPGVTATAMPRALAETPIIFGFQPADQP